tara:strand:+ start:1134 stop:1799 length:666 start_codon:yes stop_codon:yes gene_type:complete
MIRIADITLSILSLVFFMPLLLIFCIILKFTGQGKIFYSQKRVGRNGLEFRIFKFVTMLDDSEKLMNKTITVRNDERVLPFGKFLRKTKFNEFPQLWNVILGEMSLIGPRPLIKKNFDLYDENHKEAILKSKPGLSGIGSILFSKEEELMSNNDDAWNFYKEKIIPYKGSLEMWFSKNNNFKLYCELIFFTVYVMITQNLNIMFKYYASLPKIPDVLKDKL